MTAVRVGTPHQVLTRFIKSRRVRWVGHVARIWEVGKNTFGVLVEKLEGKKQLGRTRSRWDDNVKMDLEKEVVG